eukprot:TRINITY_DN3230_c0_g1_i3.p1 TRINITY_DN3230_c0_g1~~TRINITY_DN3230_c0_g1_i3.p1  ORF type:complete len:564 (-),score=77.56 TRINITY_DN3230_c0_g1_i3:537-2228(-)
MSTTSSTSSPRLEHNGRGRGKIASPSERDSLTTSPASTSAERPKRRSSFNQSALSVPSSDSKLLRVQTIKLQDDLRAKAQELDHVTAEVRALKQASIAKDKALTKTAEESERLQERISQLEKQLEGKNLELKRAFDQKKEAFSALAAAESTMRRLQASKKENFSPPPVVDPVQSQLKSAMEQISKLQEDSKAQERLMRTKDAALLDSDSAVKTAEARAAQVDVAENEIRDLNKRIEGLEEENRTLDRLYRLKVDEVKKLTNQITSLEETVTAAGAGISTIKDYQRQVKELQSETKTLQDELSRTKVAANRVATVVANEWKEDDEKVIPLKQWMEERRCIQAEIQSLKEKIFAAERVSKYECHMKERYQLRLKVIEESLKSGAQSKDIHRRLSLGKATPSISPSQGSDSGDRLFPFHFDDVSHLENSRGIEERQDNDRHSENGPIRTMSDSVAEDAVPGVLYDHLQKEVISLRKLVAEKEHVLTEKDDNIQGLTKKVELLSKALEVESKKGRREVLAMEKEVAAMKFDLASSSSKARRSSVVGLSTAAAGQLRPSRPSMGPEQP